MVTSGPPLWVGRFSTKGAGMGIPVDPIQMVLSRLNDKPGGWLGSGHPVMMAEQGLGTWP